MNTPPIPVPDSDSGSHTFYVKFKSFFLLNNIGGLAWSLPVLIWFLLAVGNLSPIAIIMIVMLAAVLGVAVSAPICLIQIQASKVILDENELHSTNAWGKRAFVHWSEISSANHINFLTLPYLKVSTHQKKNVLWIPLFLSDMEGFRAAVAEYTLPDNPLRIALES